MKLQSFCVSLVFLLAAGCGNSPKLTPIGKGGHDTAPSSPCEGSYNPISLFVPGATALTEVENLPAGTYSSNGMEFYANDDQGPAGNQQAHFQEVMMGFSAVVRPICHTVIDPANSAEYEFPALNVLTISAAGVKSREDAIYQIQNNRNQFTTGKVVLPGLSATGMSGVMAKFTQARLYRLGPASYELHAELRTPTVAGTVSKWVLQKILYAPLVSN